MSVSDSIIVLQGLPYQASCLMWYCKTLKSIEATAPESNGHELGPFLWYNDKDDPQKQNGEIIQKLSFCH